MKLSFGDFKFLDLPELLINIWSYNDEGHKNCSFCKEYEKWCIIIAKSLWQDNYPNFDFVIENVKKHKLFNLGSISSENEAAVYYMLKKIYFFCKFF